MTTTFLNPVSLPYRADIYDNTHVFKKANQVLNHPAIPMVVNSTGLGITLDMAGGDIAPLIVQGDLIEIVEDGGDGSVLYTGIVEDFPDTLDQITDFKLTLNPIGVELADADFNQNYSSLTDIGQMIRDAVARTQHCTATTSTVPNTGITRIFNFNEANPLIVLQTAAKMAGVNYLWFVDELGQVWFGPSTSAPTYDVVTRIDAPVRIFTSPITSLRNYVKGFGAILPNTTDPISAVYDQTAGSPYGRKALSPRPRFPNLTDQTTLQSIVNTIGASLNQPITTIVLKLPFYNENGVGTRINLAQVGGALVSYFEPALDDVSEVEVGSGTWSPAYVIMQVDVDGPEQTITAKSITLSVDDFVNEINDNLTRVSNDTTILPISPGQIIGGTTGGPTTPSAPAWVFAQWSTGIENVAQTNNAYIIVKWTPNSAGDNVARYEIRYSKNADGNYMYISALTGVVDGGGRGFAKIAGLIQGASYTFEIRAYNTLGKVSAWSSTQAQIAALDVAAPATPTGLTAIRTPRGALVSWNGNTEADLKGYFLQVSVAGGSFGQLLPDASLVTSFAYIAPSGTMQGTSLVFQVASTDWSGNNSAWSASSTAVNTDPIFTTDVAQSVLDASAIANASFEDTGTGTLPAAWGGTLSGTGSLPVRGTGQQATGAAELDLTSTAGVGNYSRAYSRSTPVRAGDIWYLSCLAKASVATTNNFYFRVCWDNVANDPNDGILSSNDVVGNQALTTSYQKFEGKVTVPAGATYMHIVFYNYQPNVVNTTYVDDVFAAKSIGTVMIQDAAITNAQIANLAVDNAKIANMVVDKLLAGNLTVFGTMTTGGLQTAASGARLVLDSTGIRIYDGSATDYGVGAGITAQLKNDGTAFFKGTVSASKVYGSVVATSASFDPPVTGAGSGFSLAGNFLDLFTQGSVAEGTRYWYASTAADPYSLAGQLAAGTITFPAAGPGTADSVTEVISLGAGGGADPSSSAGVIATFKPNTSIVFVKKGTFISGTATSVTPAFGQATTAGNLLVASVSAENATGTASASTGWTKAVEVINSANQVAAIWYRMNCGASEAAPTFTAASGASVMSAVVAEFSGALTAAALDKTGTVVGTTSHSIVMTTSGPDAGVGELILTSTRWAFSSTFIVSFSDTYNNATKFNLGGGGLTTRGANATDGTVSSNNLTGIALQLTSFVGLEAVTIDNSLARGFISTQYSDDGNGAIIALRKSRGTVANPTTVVNGDALGALYSQAYDGTKWLNPGLTGWLITGAVSTGVVPTDYVISTSAGTVFQATKSGHWLTKGSTPTLGALQANIGSQSISGTDIAMRVQVTTGNPAPGANGTVALPSFGTAWGSTPAVVPGANISTSGQRVINVSSSGFSLLTESALSVTTSYTWSVISLGYL